MIEAAFILPIFFLLMLTALEFGMLIFYSFVMESAMFDATRLARVSENNQQTVDAVRKAIQDRSFGLIPAEEIIITTEPFPDFSKEWKNAEPEQCTDSNGNIIPGEFCPCSIGWIDKNNNNVCDIGPPPLALNAPGKSVFFIAFYKKVLYSPILSFMANTTGNRRLLTAATIIRNEP